MTEQIELIDRNALIKDIAEGIRLADEWERESYEKKDECGLKHAIATRQSLLAMIERVKKAPTIKAKPVRHWRWILCEDQHGVDNDNNNYAYFCSQCHYQDVHSKYAKVNFCGNCGADMREEGADNG